MSRTVMLLAVMVWSSDVYAQGLLALNDTLTVEIVEQSVVYSGPNWIKFDRIGSARRGDVVDLVLDTTGLLNGIQLQYWKIAFGDSAGYVRQSSLPSKAIEKIRGVAVRVAHATGDPRFDPMREMKEAQRIEVERVQAARRLDAKMDSLREVARLLSIESEFLNSQFKPSMYARQLEIGMTGRMVELTLGDPDDVNRTVSAGLVEEQWVYDRTVIDDLYVYFENGVVVAYQE